MNKKVLKTMIWLVMGELVAWYVLKIFFPNEFVMVINNENLIKAGQYIDNNKWAYYLFGICTSFLTYWLYMCAVTKQWKLKWYQNIIILLVIGASIGTSFWDIKICTAINYTSLVFIPFLFKANLKEVAIVYTTHLFAQHLTLSIRELPFNIQYMNSLTFLLLTLECYFWLFLFYLYYNYKKEV